MYLTLAVFLIRNSFQWFTSIKLWEMLCKSLKYDRSLQKFLLRKLLSSLFLVLKDCFSELFLFWLNSTILYKSCCVADTALSDLKWMSIHLGELKINFNLLRWLVQGNNLLGSLGYKLIQVFKSICYHPEKGGG